MEITSVRALKAQILEEILRPLIAELRAREPQAPAASSLTRLSRVEAGIALGVTRGADRRDYRLAVRLQRRLYEADATLRRQIEDIARQEVEIRYIGRVAKRSQPLPAAPPWHQARQRPLLIGCSIGHYAVTAGTLGAFALEQGRPVILSNNHVLANENAGKAGDAILQPGVYDGGRRGRDRVGALGRFVPLKKKGANLVDAALATLDPGIAFDGAALTGLGRLRGLREAPIEPGDAVAKVGRTTGMTCGVVSAIELDEVVVSYERGALSFERQIEIESRGDETFSAGGDSGSVIVDAEGFACALLFAGSEEGGANGKGLTYANDLRLVLGQLNVELAGEAALA